jgi:hydrogenase expression/formation protein HypE
LAHGSGGKASHNLVREIFLKSFDNPLLAALEDSALLSIDGAGLTFSTDSYVVDPIFFTGGNIGSMAVHGTVNDLLMRGSTPLYISVGFILEEGFPLDDLRTIVHSMSNAADLAGVKIVAGDTKVVPAGKADKIFINTTGIGVVTHQYDISGHNGKPGDKIILSGTMGDHGATILCQREGIEIKGNFSSDSAPLNDIVTNMLAATPEAIHVLRDPTRGGVGTTLNELAQSSNVGVRIHEQSLPVRDEVRGACELLGLDPLYLANEGKLLAFVAPEQAEKVLQAIRRSSSGGDAVIIGEVVEEHVGQVVMVTGIGGRRVVEMLYGEALPRIC